MKLNKFMIVGMILLTIITLGAVCAADSNDNSTVELQQDVIELSDVDENTSLSNEQLNVIDDNEVNGENEENVTSDNILNYFDDEGVLLESVTSDSLKFKGNFSNTFEYITIQRPIEITGEDATFTNVGFKIVSDDVSLSNLKFVATNSYSEGLIKIDGANNIVVSGLDINYCVGDAEAIAINVNSQNSRITNNNIHFESHVVSDNEFAIALNFNNCQDIVAEYNNITCILPALNALYDESYDFMGLNKVNPIRIDDVNGIKLRYNKIISNTNAILSEFPTIQSILIVHSENSEINNNNISMVDTLTPAGNASFLYGISFAKVTNVTISNCDFFMSTTGGIETLGTAYAIQGIEADINIIGNNIHSVSKGPMIGIYVTSMSGEVSKAEIRDNFINVTGHSSATDPWGLVTGIEIQNGNATIINNTIYTYSINPYNENNFHYGISYAQWMYGERSFSIRNNHVYSGGKYTISTVATKEDEHTSLVAMSNYLVAHELTGDASIDSSGAILLNNKPVYSGGNSSQENGTEIEQNSSGEVGSFTINAGNVWIGQDNAVTVNIPDATGQVTIKINGNTYNVDLVNGSATKTLSASELNLGDNVLTVNYNNITHNATFKVLNGIVTKDNVFSYFDQSNGGKLYDYVPEGTTLDFQGEIKASELGDFNIYINKALNIISSTNDAFIDLNTIAGSMMGSSPGNRFVIDKNGSGTNMTGITLHNTQFWLSNTNHVVLDNINVTVENQKVGSGVGVTSIRDNSSYITVKNSYFSTFNNGGSSTLVLGWANYCTVENNIIRGEGNVGNLFYLNTYNVDNIPDGALVNSYNNIKNNIIYGPSQSSLICRAMAIMGKYNLIENNTVYYSGEGIILSDNAINIENITIANNKFYNGSSAVITRGISFYNNYITGKLTLNDNANSCNNTAGGLTVSGDNVTVENNIINGAVTINAVANLKMMNSVITGDISIERNGEFNFISGNAITGTLTVKGNDNIISENNITSSGTYAIVMTDSRAKNNNVTQNTIFASDKYGNDAVNYQSSTNLVFANRPYSGEVTVFVNDIKVGENATVKIYVPQDATGSVKVIFNESEINVAISNGEGSAVLSNLASGEYTLRVVFSGDAIYADNTISKAFKVSKWDISIASSVTVDVSDNDNPTISINLNSDVGGILTVNVNGSEYISDINDGNATVVISGLNAGTYNALVSYSGDDKYKSDSTNVNFIIRGDSELNMTVSDIYVDDVENIVITMNNMITGQVILQLDANYTVNIVNGVGNYQISDLNAGNYTVKVIFNGNIQYLPGEVTKSFKVSKINLNDDVLEMSCDGAAVEFSIYLADATGSLIVEIDKNNYTQTLENGNAVIKPTLTPGTYDARVIYSGDCKYMSVSKNYSFIIKSSPDLSVSAENILVGDDMIINVSANSQISQGVVFIFNGQSDVKLINGKGNITISNLSSGNYTVVVKFTGNDYFFENQTEVSFTVSKHHIDDSSITIEDAYYSIDLPQDATGSLIVFANNTSYTEKIADGKSSINITDLTPGCYDIVVSYTGDEKYESVSKSTKLTVPKYETPISALVSDINVGDIALFNVTLPENATGTVIVQINLNNYSGNVNDGIATVKVSGLGNGTYDAQIIYLGDNNYLANQTVRSLKVSKVILSDFMTITDESKVTVSLPDDATGDVVVSINSQSPSQTLVDGKATFYLNLNPGNYTAVITYLGDDKYEKVSKNVSLSVTKYSSPISASVENISVGDVAVFKVTVPDGATGTVLVTVNGKNCTGEVENGIANVHVSGLPEGTYTAKIKYFGDTNYAENEISQNVSVFKVVLSDSVITLSGYEIRFSVADATGSLTVKVDNTLYKTVNIVAGSASVVISSLSSGNHPVSISYSGDDKYQPLSKTVTIHVPTVKLTGSDVSMIYTSGTSYKVKLTSDGKAIASKTVTFVINGKRTTAKTDKNGVASVKITLPPKTAKYTVTATYNGIKVTNKVKVNSILSAKDLKVKKSAKSLAIKVTLKKVNGKYLKSKKVTLKFNGKTYNVKTNKKGVATFKITKNVFKKLKAGKKYTYKVTYLKDTTSKKITVKK